MKHTLFALAMLFSIASFAQNTILKKLSLGVTYSPNYSYRTLAKTKYDYTKEGRDKYSNAIYGFSTGIRANYQLNQRFSVSLGVEYASKGYEYEQSVEMDMYPDYSGTLPAYHTDYYKDKFEYLDIPVTVHYQFLQREHIYLKVLAGISSNIYLSSETTVKISSPFNNEDFTQQGDASQFNAVNFSGIVGVGVGYQLTENFTFNLEPVFRHDFTSVYSSSDTKEYQYSFGVNVGLFYTL